MSLEVFTLRVFLTGKYTATGAGEPHIHVVGNAQMELPVHARRNLLVFAFFLRSVLLYYWYYKVGDALDQLV